MKEYITGIVIAACASGIIICISPDSGRSGIGKYVRYIAALAVLVVICSPLKGMISDFGNFMANTDGISNSTDTDGYDYNASNLLMVDSSAAGISKLMSEKISQKFCTSADNVRVKLSINYGKITEVKITDAEILLYADAAYLDSSAVAEFIQSEFGFPVKVYTGG